MATAPAITVSRRPVLYRIFEPGQEVHDAKPGDFLLTHSRTWTGRLIRFGQRMRYWGNDAVYAYWNHAAIFVNDSGDIVEALGSGVQRRNVSVYAKTQYHVVYLQSVPEDDRKQEIAFADHCLHDKYGFLTIVSLAFSLLTGAKFSFGIDGQMICSGLVARCLERTGEIFVQDSWHVTPADLAKHYSVIPPEKRDTGTIPSRDDAVKERSR